MMKSKNLLWNLLAYYLEGQDSENTISVLHTQNGTDYILFNWLIFMHEGEQGMDTSNA